MQKVQKIQSEIILCTNAENENQFIGVLSHFPNGNGVNEQCKVSSQVSLGRPR